MADLSALFGVVNPTKRKQWGIPPKGKGPHKAEQYELPMPPADHPRAKSFARAVLMRARAALSRCRKADVIAQVRKANTALYGAPNPSPKQKRAGQAANRTKRKTFPHNESREAYVDVPNPPGSTEQISTAILDAARASSLFGGPCCNYGQAGFSDETSVRDWDISILWLFPMSAEVVIQNSRTAEIWRVSYGIDATGVASFGTPVPAEIEVTAKGQEALKKARESGIKAPRFVRINEAGRISKAVLTREASGDSSDDAGASAKVQLISAGPGNSHDKNYYTPEFITQTIETGKFAGVQCYYDHPTKSEEDDQPERSVRKIAGWFSDPEQGVHTSDELGEQPAALATFHAVVGDSMAQSLLATAREYAQSYPDGEFIGFSIYSYGVSDGTRKIDGEEWTNVVAMTECFSVDLVTHAGARGGPIFSSQEKNMPKGGSTSKGVTPRAPGSANGKGGKPNGRTTESNPFLDPDIKIDIRTAAEKKADRDKVKRSYRETLLKSNPTIRRAAFAAIGVQEAAGDGSDGSGDDADSSTGQNALGMPKLTPEQDDALDQALGLVDGGMLDQMLDSVLGGNDDMSGDESDDEVDESEEGTTEEADLTTDAIDNMGDADVRKALKRMVKGKTEGAGDATAEANRIVASLQKRIGSLEGQIEGTSRTRITESLVEQFKVPSAHQPLFRRIVMAANSPADMTEAARAYAQANFAGVGATLVGVTRESQSNATTPNFFRK